MDREDDRIRRAGPPSRRHPLLELLLPVRRRLTLFRLAGASLTGLLAGSAAALLPLAASRIWPLLHARWYAAALVCAGAAGGAAYAIWRRATAEEAARVMDRTGTNDAVCTALGALESEAPVARLQREEAIEQAKRYGESLKERLPWPSWRNRKREAAGLAAIWLAAALLLAWPNPLDDRAKALAEARHRLTDAAQELDELAEEIRSRDLPEEAKEPLARSLDELRRDMKRAADPDAALEQFEETLREMEAAAERAREAMRRLDAAADALRGEPALRPVGQALQNRDAAAVRQSLDTLRDELRRLSDEERKAIAEALERIAGQQPDEAGALKQALEKAAEQVRGGESGGEDSDALDELADALDRELTQAELEALAEQLAERLGESGQTLAEQLAAQGFDVPSGMIAGAATGGRASGSAAGSGGAPSGAAGGEGGESESGGQSGQGQSAGEGSGTGSGQGAGTGKGAGAEQGAGAGAGQGAGGGSGQGAGGGNGQGAGSGSGQGGLAGGTGAGGRGLVTTPRSMQGSGNVQQDGGPASGGSVQTGGQSPTVDGMTRPYEEVYAEYAAEAKQALTRTPLPGTMQQRVQDYFDEIQPGRQANRGSTDD